MKNLILAALLCALVPWSWKVATRSEYIEERLERERTAMELYTVEHVQPAFDNDEVLAKIFKDGHNKQNKTLFTHEQILKGRLPKPR